MPTESHYETKRNSEVIGLVVCEMGVLEKG